MLYNKYLKQNKHKRIIFYYRLMAAPTAEASSDLLSCFKHILMPLPNTHRVPISKCLIYLCATTITCEVFCSFKKQKHKSHSMEGAVSSLLSPSSLPCKSGVMTPAQASLKQTPPKILCINYGA